MRTASSPTETLDAALEVTDPEASTEGSVQLQSEHARLLAAIRRLPLGRREVVLLTLEGLPQREIAQVLAASPKPTSPCA